MSDPTERLSGDPILVHCPGSGGEVAFNDRCSYCGGRTDMCDDCAAGERGDR